MYPILARFRWGFLYSYTAVWVITLLLALGQTAWLNRQPHFQLPRWLDAVLAAVAGALLGGRLGFVLANLAYFQVHPDEAWQVWRGGYEFGGALLGAGLGFALWAWWLKPTRPWMSYADLLSPALALCYAGGWLACGLEGCGYGQTAFLGWATADLPDSFGVYAVRYPTQWWGLGAGLLLWLGSSWLALRAMRPGFLFWLTLLLLNVLHCLITLWRGDVWLGEQIVALGTAVVAAVITAVIVTKREADR